MYSPGPYFLSKLVGEIPMSIIIPVLLVCIIYFPLGFDTDAAWKFPAMMFSLVLAYMSTTAYAFVISSVFSDRNIAVTLTPILIVPMMLFAGFFVNQNNIPVWITPLEYISMFKFAY